MDYGAALEMRFGATRRGFESRPLRHLARPRRERWLRPRSIRATMKDVDQRSASAAAIRDTGQIGAAERTYRSS